MLRRISGAKRDGVTGQHRRLHNVELNDLYSSPNIVRVIKSRMIWARYVARMGARSCVYTVLVGKPEGRRSLGRPMPRWEDNIHTIFKKCDGEARTGFFKPGLGDRWRTVVSAVMNLPVPENVGNFFTS